MAKYRSLKNSFIAGEISHSALGRTDLPQYTHACKILRNAIPLLSGGVYRRPGTIYESTYGSTLTNSVPRLFPFVYSQSEAYVIQIGTTVATGVGVISAIRSTGNKGGQYDTSSITGAVSYATPTWVTGDPESGFDDQVWDVHHVQSADVMWLVHPLHKPRKLFRTAQDTFSVTEWDFDSTGTRFSGTKLRDCVPYLPQNQTAITLQIDNLAVGTGRTLTASSSFFWPTHGPSTVGGTDGAMFKVDNAGTIGVCKVTKINSIVSAEVEVVIAFGAAATPVATWWESAWSHYRGWPRTIGFFQQRLVMGGTSSQPDTLHFSETSDYDQFSKDTRQNPGVAQGATGSEAFSGTLSSNQLNQIQWISSGDTLVVGTTGDEWIVDFDRTNSAGLGADNAYISVTSRYGSSHIQAVRAGNEIFFVSPAGDSVQALVFNDNEKSYVAEPVQLLHDEFPQMETASIATTGRRKIKQVSWDEQRKTLWCLDTVGNMRGLTRDRKLNVSMWHSHQLGGYDHTKTGGAPTSGGNQCSDPVYTNASGTVGALVCIPGVVLSGTDLWLVVKRYINSSYIYMIERIVGKNFGSDTVFADLGYDMQFLSTSPNVMNFSDCSRTSSNFGGGIIVPDASHLTGEAIVGTAHTPTRGMFRISSDSSHVISNNPPSYATLSYAFNTGLPYTTIIEPVRVEAGSQIGSSVGAVQRIHQATIRFFRTIGCRMGSSEASLETIIFRRPGDLMGNSAELYSGEKVLKLTSDYDRDGSVYITQPDPLPFCVVSISVEGMTGD